MLYLNTDHLKRCLQTLDASLTRYQQAEAGSIDQEVFRNAIVKGYELTQETALKLLKKALKAYGYGGKKLDASPVKDILRLAAVHELIRLAAIERWFAYRDNRNDTAHDYAEAFAEQTLALMPRFLEDIMEFANTLEQKPGKDADA